MEQLAALVAQSLSIKWLFEWPWLSVTIAVAAIAVALTALHFFGPPHDPGFWDWYVRQHGLQWDVISCITDLVLHILCLWRLWRPDKHWYILTLTTSGVLTALQLELVLREKELYILWRAQIVAVRRILACASMSWAMYYTFKPGESVMGMVRLMLGTSCAFSTCTHCLMLRERYMYSTVYNVVTSSMLMSSANTLCEDALQYYVTNGRQLVVQFARALQDLSHISMSVLGMDPSGFRAFSSGKTSQPTHHSASQHLTEWLKGPFTREHDHKVAHQLCVCEMRTLQMVLGIVIPMYITYIMDLRAKRQYARIRRQGGAAAAQQLRQQQQEEDGVAGLLGGGPVGLVMTVMAPQAFIYATVLCWQVLTTAMGVHTPPA